MLLVRIAGTAHLPHVLFRRMRSVVERLRACGVTRFGNQNWICFVGAFMVTNPFFFWDCPPCLPYVHYTFSIIDRKPSVNTQLACIFEILTMIYTEDQH